MKNEIIVIFSMFFLMTGEGLSMATEQDFKGSKDHPLISRMPNFWISDYKDIEFDSYKFIGADNKPVIIEGHKVFHRIQIEQWCS